MTEQQYRAVIAWFQERPAAKGALYLASRGAVAAVYVLYGVLLLWLAAWRQPLVIPAALVPAAAFWVGSALRARINRPRPYTALGYQPLFPKMRQAAACPAATAFRRQLSR